jgi:hypothetical protein
MRFIFITIIVLFCLLGPTAKAVMELPPLLPEGADQHAFTQKLIQENPWVIPSGIGSLMQQHVGVEQRFLPGLLAHPEFQKQAKLRPNLITIHVEKVQQVMGIENVLPPEALARIKSGISQTLENVEDRSDQSLTEIFDEKITEGLREIAKSDPKGILVGMVNCLDRADRKPLFQISSSQELLEKLSNLPQLTDAVLQASFQGAAHHISEQEISRDFLLNRVRDLLQVEKEMDQMLRAKWFLANVSPEMLAQMTKDRHKISKWIENTENPEAFDIGGAEEERAGAFFQDLLSKVGSDSKEVTRRAKGYLDRIENAWKEADRSQERRMVTVATPYFTIREVPPYLAVYRSALTGDCGTRDDFPFPYSPLERNFFIFDNKGEALGYFGATLINTQGILTLFAHDINGLRLPQEYVVISLNVVSQLLPQFGVKRMTMGFSQYANYQEGRGAALVNEYLDVGIRNFLNPFAANPHGDRPQDNPNSALFVPHLEQLKGLRFRFESAGLAIAEQKKPETPREGFLKLLDLADGGQSVLYMDFLGFTKEERERMLATTNNTDHAPLEVYYERLEELFSRFDIGLSEKFMKKHENYFTLGHLNSKDVLTTDNEDYSAKTIAFVIAIIKRGQDRGLAYDLIAQNPSFFERSEKFRTYVEGIPAEGVEHLNRLKRLIQAKLDSELVAPNQERLIALMNTEDQEIQTWAAKTWITRHGSHGLPSQVLETFARALENEDAESEAPSLAAVRMLMRIRTKQPAVIDSLHTSVLEDENIEIAYRAAIALLRNGYTSEEVGKIIIDNQQNPELSEKLRILGRATYLKNVKKGCMEILQVPVQQ